MCSMVAAAQHQSSAHETNPVASLVNSLALAGHTLPSNGGPPMSMSHLASMRMSSPAGSIQDLRISPAGSGLESPISSPLGLTVSSSMEPAINLGIGNKLEPQISLGIGNSMNLQNSMSNMAHNMSNNMGNTMGNNIGIGVSGMTYKPPRSFTSPRPENLFQEDIDDLVKPLHNASNSQHKQDTMTSIKMEPLTECRGE